MSIRYGLLALLERGPSHGAQLRSDFETRTGTTWPLNVGQVYTTLARLERDGLVASQPGADGRQQYALSGAGRLEVRGWYARPVDRSQPARDELAIKIAMAAGAPGGDARAVISAQRRHTLRVLQGYARLTARALAGGAAERKGLAWLLVLEQLVFQTEAEVRWLAHCDRVLGDLPEPAAPPPVGEPPDGPDGTGRPAAERRPSRSGAARAGGGAGPVTRPHHRRTVPTRPRTTAPPRRLSAARPPNTAPPRRLSAARPLNTAPPRRPDAASQPRRTAREGTTA
ncbi:PadR family transcriptional regulator [Streptomyces bohaiensis]|uniref:PadR family transcriptional regulator n=1 Tax=Streptomyces bohaiensis TaxID=1431344 RepID=A0ABX1CBF0_9ACTN|nr:PadR family transcriptional regulator [Streptomyces bohaiensis]